MLNAPPIGGFLFGQQHGLEPAVYEHNAAVLCDWMLPANAMDGIVRQNKRRGTRKPHGREHAAEINAEIKLFLF